MTTFSLDSDKTGLAVPAHRDPVGSEQLLDQLLAETGIDTDESTSDESPAESLSALDMQELDDLTAPAENAGVVMSLNNPEGCTTTPGCGCPCHFLAGVKHMMACCDTPPLA